MRAHPGIAALLAAAPLLAWAASAGASCESMWSVQSRELDFLYTDVMPAQVDEWAEADQHRHFRGLAHALAVAQSCADSAREYSCEAGTPPRTPVHLAAGSSLQPGKGYVEGDAAVDPASGSLVRRCASADWDSSCVLWTCEVGRFADEEAAKAALERLPSNRLPGDAPEGFDRALDARIVYACCGGNWEPGGFVTRIGSRRYSARYGLYFTAEDAGRAERRLRRAIGARVLVVPQRVDGPLLEQALREPPYEDE